ncbi:hypothetical protein [Azotobacter armeniacus]
MAEGRLIFTDSQLERVRPAGEAFHRLSGMTSADPDWSHAYVEWQALAESIAVVLIAKVESLEGSR